VDSLPQVLGVIRPAERAGQPGGGEGERQDMVFEVAHLGIRLDEGPGAPLDFRQRLQDLRPGAAEDFDVRPGSGGRGARG